MDDLKGLKIRTYDKVGAEYMALLGSIPLAIPFPDLYSSLATGLVDAVYTSTQTAVDAKFWEVLNYYTPINISIGHHMFCANLDAFNALDKETQQILMDVAQEEEEAMWAISRGVDEKAIAMCVENDMEVIEPTSEFLSNLREKADIFVEKWIEEKPKSSSARKLYDEYLEKVGKK